MNIDRFKFSVLTETLGKTSKAIKAKIGDTTKNPAAMLWLENALIRLRGSTVFHDDTSAKNYTHFNTDDNIGLGLQNTSITSISTNINHFPLWTVGDWNPSYGPPCIEGWGILNHRGWASYPINIPDGEEERLTYVYPTRYNAMIPNSYVGSLSNNYERIKMWENARFWSFYCDIDEGLDNTTYISFVLTANDIDGIKIYNEATNEIDIGFYSDVSLIQTHTTGWASSCELLTGTLTKLGSIVEKQENGDYKVSLNVIFNEPTHVWAKGSWWHVIMYWGSTDSFVDNAIAFDSTGLTEVTLGSDQLLKWTRKNFFRKDIVESISFSQTADTKYLKATGRVHKLLEDGGYTAIDEPNRYLLQDNFPAADNSFGALNSFAGYADLVLNKESVVPVIICARTDNSVGLKVITGPEITPEFFSGNWSDCPYFPPTPNEYVLLARYILCRSDNDLYGVPSRYNAVFDPETGDINIGTSKISVAWLEQSVLTYCLPRLQDEHLYYLLQPLITLVKKNRDLNVNKSIINAAYEILIPSLNIPNNVAPNVDSVKKSTSVGSKMFRGYLKHPFSEVMKSTITDEAISFETFGRSIIEDLVSSPPSTELLRLDSNKLYLTNQILEIPSKLEIYQPYTVLSESVGDRISLDYTFRLDLVDAQENILSKNWYIMASRYLLSKEEYAQQDKSQEGVAGYFTSDTLSEIDEWRLQGYAGIVPDLSMGQSRVLDTRQVKPVDGTQMTFEQYTSQLRSAGMSEKDINEAVLVYTEDVGDFYAVNTSHYPNLFTGIKNASLSITQYNNITDNYWTYSYAGDGVAWDSFTIAQDGMSIGELEQFGSQSNDLLPMLSVAYDEDFDFIEDGRAFLVVSNRDLYVNQVKIKVKSTALITNTDGAINFNLYSDDNGPDKILTDSGILKYSAITTDYNEFDIPLSCNIKSNVNYWLVFEKTVAPTGGIIQISIHNI